MNIKWLGSNWFVVPVAVVLSQALPLKESLDYTFRAFAGVDLAVAGLGARLEEEEELTSRLSPEGINMRAQLNGGARLSSERGGTPDVVPDMANVSGINQSTSGDLTLPFAHAPFGGRWDHARTATALASTYEHANETPRVTLAVTRRARGADTNGPGWTNQAMAIFGEKIDWLTSETLGEVDGAHVVTAQGKSGDTGGINIGTYKRDGRWTGGNGSTAAIEAHAYWVGPGGPLDTNWAVATLMAYGESPGGAGQSLGRGDGHGMYVEGRKGTIYSAYSAVHDFSSNDAHFTNYFVGSRTRNQADVNFRIDGNGNIETEGGLKLGSGAKLVRVLSETQVVDFPQIAANGVQTAEVPVAGAQAGDGVIVTRGAGHAGPQLAFHGHVGRSGTVEVIAYNNGREALDPAGQTLRVTVLGF